MILNLILIAAAGLLALWIVLDADADLANHPVRKDRPYHW